MNRTDKSRRSGVESLERRLLLSAYQYDSSFGTNGISELPLPNPTSGSSTLLVAELSDGDILLATVQQGQPEIVLVSRFEPDGALNQSFGDSGDSGTATLNAWSIDAAAIGLDDKLVVAGQLTPADDAFIARFTPDGQLDATFAGDGILEYSSTDGGYHNKQLVVTANSAIALLGPHIWGVGGEKRDFIVRRFTPTGSLDAGFSGDGVVVGGRDDRPEFGSGGAVAVDAQGRTVISGLVDDGMLVSRLTAAGEFDNSFGTAGFTLIEDVDGPVTRIAFQDDGGILIVAAHRLARLTESGQPDTTFGGDGLINHSGYTITDLVIDRQARITLVRTLGRDELFRFLADGTPDPTFSAGSHILSRVGRIVSVDYGIIAADGAILGGGDTTDLPLGPPPFTPRGRGIARFVAAPDVFVDADKVLQVRGTPLNDTVTLDVSSGQLRVTRNGEQFSFAAADVDRAHVVLGEGDNAATISVPMRAAISSGAGNDMIDARGSSGQLWIRLGAGNDTVLAGSGDDDIVAEAGDNLIDGGGGNDRIATVYGGNSSLIGGEGNDHISSEDGNDSLIGGAGNDLIRPGDGENLVEGGDGDDLIKAGAGVDTIHGGTGNDRIYAGDGNNLVFTGDGDDYVQSGTGADTLWGEIGYDSIKAGGGDDVVNGGAGKDCIWGQDGNDRLYGRRGDDAIDGGAGDDRVTGEDGFDKLFGGSGNDRIFAQAGDADFVDGGDGDDHARVDELLELVMGVETL